MRMRIGTWIACLGAVILVGVAWQSSSLPGWWLEAFDAEAGHAGPNDTDPRRPVSLRTSARAGERDTSSRPPGAAPETRSASDLDADADKTDEDVRERNARTGEPSLDDAPWSEIERRIGAAIEAARETRGARVSRGLITALREQGEVQVIVGHGGGTRPLAPAIAGTRHGGVQDFSSIPFSRLRAGPEALLRLLGTDAVDSVMLPRLGRPALDRSIRMIGGNLAYADGATGAAFTVVVIDTGVEPGHPFIGSRFVEGHCFSRDALCPGGGTSETFSVDAGAPCEIDRCDHGTRVAGVAVGGTSTTHYHGVAPEATLISIMAASIDPDEGSDGAVFWEDDLLAALDMIHSRRDAYDIAAVNLSLGNVDEDSASEAACTAASPALHEAVQRLRAAGIAVVASSGNDSEPALVGWPACIEGIISVGAVADDGDVWPSSNSASFLDLLAPGVEISSSTIGGGFASASGTSFAAPHVSGAFAALRSAVPEATTDHVLDFLTATGVPTLDPRNDVTKARIDLRAALDGLRDGDLRSSAEKIGDDYLSDAGQCGLAGPELLLPLLVAFRLRRSRAGRFG